MRTLELSKNSLKFLESLPAKQYRQVVGACFDLLAQPFPHDARPLKGYEGLFRIDAGEYRIAYRANDDTIRIAVIGKRNDDDVYKTLARKF